MLNDFLLQMLAYCPEKRASAKQMLNHPWLKMEEKYNYVMNDFEIEKNNIIEENQKEKEKLLDDNLNTEYNNNYIYSSDEELAQADDEDNDKYSENDEIFENNGKYKEELDTLRSQYEMNAISAEQYNNSLSEIFNRHDTDTLSKASKALSDLTPNVTLEVDEGKNDMVTGKISVNLAWSGDAVFSIDEAEDAGKILNYVVPQEGSNVWFDGWCVLKGANVEASKAFLDFLCQPSVAANNMNYTGYTSPIAGQEIWDLALETYSIAAYDDVEEADCDEVDLSYFFDGTLDDGVEAKILVPTEERGRQFDAQYPTTDVITRCAIMKDFGEEGNEALYNMWSNFKASFIG